METNIHHLVIEGTMFYLDYDYQPKESETLEYPGCPESITINSITTCGPVDIRDFVSEDWLGFVSEKIMESINDER